MVVGAVLCAACGRADVGSSPASGTRTPSPTAVSQASPTPSSSCSTAKQPDPRTSPAFVYMPNRQEAVLFGGQSSNGQSLSDTWAWKAGCWQELTPIESPAGRDSAAVTYDPTSGTVLLFGGTGDGQFYSDTWSWNGSTWSQLASSGPLLFGGPVAGFDPVGKRPLLYGMAAGASSQTWSWNGSGWQELAPSLSPSGRESPSLALDASRGQLMLFGGLIPNSGVSNDTWLWDGNNWTLASPATSPPARFRATMGPWAGRHLVILWGGVGVGVGLGDAWTWDGTNWTQAPSPGIRADASAIDIGTGVIFFGGDGPAGYYDDLYTFDGKNWSTLT
jgi:hypothetical protein